MEKWVVPFSIGGYNDGQSEETRVYKQYGT